MSHVFQLSDEQYATLAAYAAQHAQTPETLFEKWVNEVIDNIEPFSSTSFNKQEGEEGHQEEPINHPLLEVAGCLPSASLTGLINMMSTLQRCM